MDRRELIGLSRAELEDLLAGMGQPRFRGRQLYQALYHERHFDISGITTFSKALREQLGERFQATPPEVERVFRSSDGTARYLLRLADGKEVEAVFMPEERRQRVRKTLCISTQVGCPVDCKFCLTGVMGFT